MKRSIESSRRFSSLNVAGAKQLRLAFQSTANGAVAKGWTPKEGYLYTIVRAISARINQNFDGWPSDELKKSYRSFLGKPVFVNHQNSDPTRARGKVVASRYVDAGKDDKYVECIMEIDAARFPKLAKEIKTGGLDSVSMGVECQFTRCSYCNHKAYDEADFCNHVKFYKGSSLEKVGKSGKKEDVLVFEKCYRLGFFELSYVFDPADETAVVSRVISAKKHHADRPQLPPPDEIIEGEMPTGTMPTASRNRTNREANGPYVAPPAQIESLDPEEEESMEMEERPPLHHLVGRINRLAFGETVAPEQVDTLRDDRKDFKHYIDSPKELRDPDMDRTQRFDRAQESQGLDAGRRAEDVEDIRGSKPSEMVAYRTYKENAMPTTLASRRRYADDESEHLREEDERDDKDGDDYDRYDDRDDASPDDDDDQHDEREARLRRKRAALRRFAEDEDALLDEALHDLEHAGEDDDDEKDDEDDDEDERDDDNGDDEDDDEEDAERDDDEEEPVEVIARRRRARGSGRPTLSNRYRVASRGRRRHYAESDDYVQHKSTGENAKGYVDGGPYHVDDNDQGVQEEEFISQTPTGTEPVGIPDGKGTRGESNESEHVKDAARALARRIQRRNYAQKRDLIAYEQITGRRVTATEDRSYHEDGLPDQPQQEATGVDFGEVVDPELMSTGADGVRGNSFEEVGLDGGYGAEIHPDDGGPSSARESSRAFKAFDNWLQKATGHRAKRHSSTFLRRSAARYCQATGVPVEALFPTLGVVLRQARVAEKRKQTMRRRADDAKMEVAAPGTRIEVETPVADTTDERAQASQFDREEFGHNAMDQDANPVMSSDSQIWAPGERPAPNKNANRKADGITAVRYAEAYITAGLAPNTPEEKWKIAGLAQTMRHGTIVDRIRLLDAVNTTRRTAVRRTAGVSRGQLPQGIGRGRTASTSRMSAINDTMTDSALFFKG